MKSTLRLFSILLAALCALAPAFAQTRSVANIAMYEGADRQQRLLTEARKEGTLTVYTSMAAPVFDVLKADFEKKTGIKMVVWRAGDPNVVQRILSEAQAGRPNFDVADLSALQMESLHKEGVLQRVYSPYLSKLMPSAIPPHREYAATRLAPIVFAYNTNQVSKADLPKTYQDLLDPKWKGKLGIEATDQEWFYMVVKDMGVDKGLKYFRDLVATNKPSVRTGHSLLTNLIVSGDVPLGMTVYGHVAILTKQKGAPLDWFTMKPTTAVAFASGVSKKPVHPHAAILFYDYMLSDAQKIMAGLHYVPSNREVESSVKNVDIVMTDHAVFLEEYEKWDGLWDSIVVKSK